MPFTSASFLYYFLPLVLLLYFAIPRRLKNLALLVSSMVFCLWAGPWLALPLTALGGYLHGLWIERARGTRWAKAPLFSALVMSLGILFLFKYSGYFSPNSNSLFHTESALVKLILPLGLSIATLQILSYIIDLYRGTVKVERNMLDFLTYACMFPQLVAGPVIAYRTVAEDLHRRAISLDDTSAGIRTFIFGLAKKVLLGNTLAEISHIFADLDQPTVLFHWLVALAFMLQIYYDLSGYSDMATGLGRILGFRFPLNFNYPYMARSITQFWQRWFITLGAWFRDYVYCPLAGEKASPGRAAAALLATGVLLGVWHGPGWNLALWGLAFAILVLLEKLFLHKVLDFLPRAAGHGYVLAVLLLSFALFRPPGMENFPGMLGFLDLPWSSAETFYTLRSYSLVLLVAAVGATPLLSRIVAGIRRSELGARVLNTLEPLVLIVLLLLVTGYLIEGIFNPYAYFRL